MFVPEYTITPKILKSIAIIEYGKAIIDNTVILPSWEKQLVGQAKIETVQSLLELEGFSTSEETIKKLFLNIQSNIPKQIENFRTAVEYLFDTRLTEFDENQLKNIHTFLAESIIPNLRQGAYRNAHITNKANPAEILAEIVELFDWINSIDAKDTHPVLIAGIAKARLEEIKPFEILNTATSNILGMLILFSSGYSFKGYVNLNSYFAKGKSEYFNLLQTLSITNNDYTKWLEYYASALAAQTATTQEKVKLLAKDTKIAKVNKKVRLSTRQERIVEYLQDYGIIQNKDFPILFPDKSADSVLRDLKHLVNLGIVQKTGSTKSSRYELT